MTHHSFIREAPYKLVYGAYAMIQAEIDISSWPGEHTEQEENNVNLKENL